ncbi:MAG: desulfoferrodoxin family protein [Oscillospiraceae bacterium]
MNETLFFRCEKCGNIVALIKSGGGTLVCCGQEMTNLKANSTDAAKEKHVPVLTNEGSKIKVSVGSIAHPMTVEHLIEWIALVTDNKTEIVHLKPGMEPKAEFSYYRGQDEILFAGKDDEIVPNCEGKPCNFVYGDKNTNKVVAYAYCNLHGLWKAEL